MSSIAEATTCAVLTRTTRTCEKTFSASFIPQPAENNTSHTLLGADAAVRRN